MVPGPSQERSFETKLHPTIISRPEPVSIQECSPGQDFGCAQMDPNPLALLKLPPSIGKDPEVATQHP